MKPVTLPPVQILRVKREIDWQDAYGRLLSENAKLIKQLRKRDEEVAKLKSQLRKAEAKRDR